MESIIIMRAACIIAGAAITDVSNAATPGFGISGALTAL